MTSKKSDTNTTISASNGYRYFLFCIPLTVGNLLLYAKVLSPIGIDTVLAILIALSSYFLLAFFVLRKVFFYSDRCEIVYSIKFFAKKRRIEYEKISRAVLRIDGTKEPPSLLLWLENRKLPVTICYISYEEIKLLKILLKEKEIKFSVR